MLPHFFGASVFVYIILLIYGATQGAIRFQMDVIGWLFLAFYSMYLIGCITTRHWDVASRTLEYKASFVLFPVLYAFKPREGKLQLSIVVSGMIIALVVTTLYGLVNSFICYYSGGGKQCFLTVIVSPVHHPTYFVVYWITSIIAAWYGKFQNWKNYRLVWIIPFTILGIIIHVLSLSLAGILFLMLVVFVAMIYFIYKRFGKWISILTACMLPIIGFLIITKTPQIEGEWNGAKWYADQYLKDPQGFIRNTTYPMSGSEERLILWTVSTNSFVSHPMGVGTGNLEQTIHEALVNIGQEELAEKNLNPHNQFLQTGLEVGIFGILLLIVIFIYSVFKGIKTSNPILIVIASGLVFNSLFESMLQRQSGVVFFTLMLCFLASPILGKGNVEKPSN